MATTENLKAVLPGLNCGVCGYRTCEELAAKMDLDGSAVKRCIHLEPAAQPLGKESFAQRTAGSAVETITRAVDWKDSLGREFDFYLEHFPEDPGPREIILPHNPILTRELDINAGDILIGRPLGMSCGCPITHCGVARNVDRRTGVLTWCVTGPLNPRQHGCKDLGYYIAEGYEGIVKEARAELTIGMRYYFQPRMCMLQWRHSGLVNFLNATDHGFQVRLEGLWIG
jgi:uncharacterized Fe-S cluster-containing protein